MNILIVTTSWAWRESHEIEIATQQNQPSYKLTWRRRHFICPFCYLVTSLLSKYLFFSQLAFHFSHNLWLRPFSLALEEVWGMCSVAQLHIYTRREKNKYKLKQTFLGRFQPTITIISWIQLFPKSFLELMLQWVIPYPAQNITKTKNITTCSPKTQHSPKHR